PGCVLFQDLTAATEYAKLQDQDEVFIIGGGQIYAEAIRLNLANTMYITHINGEFPEAHTFFPEFQLEAWDKEELFRQEKDEKHVFSFSVMHYTRKS
ncbi:MAG: hypothetical protein RL106_376, partial [Bacteroidota bacterium]